MSIYNMIIGTCAGKGGMRLLLLLVLQLSVVAATAQINISGHVYGGARQADVGGSTFVRIGADYCDVIINGVYGGNDISGTIGTSSTMPLVPIANTDDTTYVDATCNAYVRTQKEATGKHLFIGKLFGGGYGDYTYTSDDEGTYTVRDGSTVIATKANKPELDKTYLEITGGTIGHVYGGGDSVTVKQSTTICIDNESEVTTSIMDGTTELLTTARIGEMKLNTTQTDPGSPEFQFARVFGGNNKADMHIRPTWVLKKGLIRDLYSGGNEGRMTSPEGLLLDIDPDPAPAVFKVDNVYGGCRRADVCPEDDAGNPVTVKKLAGYSIPDELSARVIIRGGDINNVYGGNDISGRVFGGNAVGIRASVRGNVYGGGNGSYAYTDNSDLADKELYRDYYYAPGSNTVAALNDFRPNAEQVSIHVAGTSASNPTIIHGAIYCGGNSATLKNTKGGNEKPKVELKIGSYVIADSVFLGNNGANMVKEDLLARYAGNVTIGTNNYKFSQMNLTDSATFAEYMKGAAMDLMPGVVFEAVADGDPVDYVEYSTYIGSFFCGGNVGSMIVPGKTTINFNHKVVIFKKLVGGCNDAYVKPTTYNAACNGGLLGSAAEQVSYVNADNSIKDRLELNLSGLKIQPKRWNNDSTALIWNTINMEGVPVEPVTTMVGDTIESNTQDLERRLDGGHIYGGCYNSGHVNGNVIINLNASIVDRKGEFAIFDRVVENEGEARLYGNDSYKIVERRSGVILDKQGMDVLGTALNVFGGGYGEDSEIWGSTTINMNAGYAFQIFGGGERGAIGKGVRNATTGKLEYTTYDPRYSTTINLKGLVSGVYRGATGDSDDMSEAEFIYGGGFFAPIAGNTVINLGNGRIFNSFAGSCNADILGHTETYVGRNTKTDTDLGFPWIRDHIYGGNDLGGQILGAGSFKNRVNTDILDYVYNPLKKTEPDVLNASAYIEYIQGRVDYIFGGCYGYYDYTDRHYEDYTNADGSAKSGFVKPRMGNAFINFKPINSSGSVVKRIYGAGQGYSGDGDRDVMQDCSYVLIDAPQDMTHFQSTDVFGAGDYSGVGMRIAAATARTNADSVTAAAVVDLMRGQINTVYGASYNEGITRRTVVNVPDSSTIHLTNIFGGGYGSSNELPCDAYQATVNYRGAKAIVEGAIYGGNNSYRRTLYGRVNIAAPVWQNESSGYMARVYGAGYGKDTWSQYTEVYLDSCARVYEVYGGGNAGMVLNKESVAKWKQEAAADSENPFTLYTDIGTGYTDEGLDCYLVHKNELDTVCNTNVYVRKGATVGNYAYGGGLGATATVSGTTYIGLLGGTIVKDLYAGGTSGSVEDKFKLKTFTAGTNAYIMGGTARNVYGGGWKGNIGYTKMKTETVGGKTVTTVEEDIPGTTNVVIGIRKDQHSLPANYGFYKGIPAIQRNAYSGGEGGAVFGTANLTINNGYIGYVYNASGTDNPATAIDERYEEKLHDETWTDKIGLNRLVDCGNAFGGGYDDNSSVDSTRITMWGGVVRNSLIGGGEIATVGRGKTRESGEQNSVRELASIYKAGKTHIEVYNGRILRNVFGGGKGYNVNGYGGENGYYTDGYVFGQTEVYIYGGEIGTTAGIAEGYGNVFGGGDVGYVYSRGYFNETSRKTGTGSPNHYFYYYNDGTGDVLTEDCKVVVSPRLQVREGKSVNFGGKTYGAYDYVPTEYLNTLQAIKDEDGEWAGGWLDLYTGDLDGEEERGVHIYNAVFAGGNVSSNDDRTYTNATTVFGNTTATLYDVYHRDFITVGTEHVGGLYGGGNLSMVDGYRELNITNYGTDYYGLDQQISLADYQKLTNRERAYFELQYVCMQDVTIGTKKYEKDEKIKEDEYKGLPLAYQTEDYWKQYGFCSIYAGRLLNTIQRADFCGVYGSRMVLQGAKDRVADVGDATVYTINRVNELSLNIQKSVANDVTEEKKNHGNYFGIYSVVNYLGNLTSDVKFTDTYKKYENDKTVTVNGETYYHWKTEHLSKRDRNNGVSHNQVALASGVFLELTTEMSTPTKKEYGYVTGIVELDLINVKKDIEGGGYVYAKNVHGRPTYMEYSNVILSDYNKAATDDSHTIARTYKYYTYSTTDILDHETSGNFIHKSKRIVDDCYPNNAVYNDDDKSPAHYWYIKGEVYIYDQVVSAYTGSATAYSKEVKIPLTITAGSNGRLRLLNVQPNLFAYYSDEAQTSKITSDGVKVDNESMTYYLNDVITWWDWHQLSANEQKYFVKETYVNVDTCRVDGVLYPTGTYVLENDLSIHLEGEQTDYQKFPGSHVVLDKKGNPVTNLSNMFRSSNNISHETGYVLTFDVDSPGDWDDRYTEITGTETITKAAYNNLSEADKAKYRVGPTYQLDGASGLYGQREYTEGEIISAEVYNDYTTTVSKMAEAPTGQAEALPAYVAIKDYKGGTLTVQAGNAISETTYNALPDKTSFDEALLCVNTIQLGEESYVLRGELVAASILDSLAREYFTYNNSKLNTDLVTEAEARKYVEDHLTKAYYCTKEGLYGGQYFESGTNYNALKSWCTLTSDRDKFNFNYDALDVLVDSSFPGEGNTGVYHTPYSDVKPVEYVAFYTGGNSGTETLTYVDDDDNSHTLAKGDVISRSDFESYIKNDQCHYTRVEVAAGGQALFFATENFIDGGTPFGKGQDLSEKDCKSLSQANKSKVDTVEIANSGTTPVILYYCYEDYGSVSKGTVITSTAFQDLTNDQKKFIIQGKEPTEVTTLYVSRESNAKDVTTEKVISVVYQYTYYEEDEEGDGIKQTNELHVVNIRLQLESGAPEIGTLATPPTVLPGNPVGLKAPPVNPGLYEVLTNGWELYSDSEDAENHRNGVPFTNNVTPLYWYQNQKAWVAFYSKTYLGKTYSNAVPLSVANYHDLDAVMADTLHHLYVDSPDVDRASKIYIDNRDCTSNLEKSELDLFKDFFDLSLQSEAAADGETKGHSLLNNHVRAGRNLDFILNSDVSPKKYVDWEPIGKDNTTGDAGRCFDGTLHGDGYTISGLNNSLFAHLCGEVYNLGVTGSFTSAGIADTGGGYVENCWVATTGSIPEGTTVKAVFGNPSDASSTQVVNCYYPETNAYADGAARPMKEREFYNGTVAYNLNGFYLNKRYYDQKQTSGIAYSYLKPDADGVLPEEMTQGYYPASYAIYPLTGENHYGYVENRFADGDFRYAGGAIPETSEIRQRVVVDDTEPVVVYVPIWPDDYIYFGQMLTYGYNSLRPHQDQPSRIVKDGGRLSVSNRSNRVCRAPAYYGSRTMDVAHFNIWANLAAYSKPTSLTDDNLIPAYPGMTAIDFAGHKDSGYAQGLNGKWFFPPLLDDDGLQSIVNNGETYNLLVYAPSESANSKTYNVLNGYFKDLTFNDYFDETSSRYDDGKVYGRVDIAPTSTILGHLVQSDLTAVSDHLLVDEQEFNCPIAYSFASGKHMWYQRTPGTYADRTAGWEGISLPFEAEYVTTDRKGEITHFYGGSKESTNGTHSKIGHEYWLREFTTGGEVATEEGKQVFKANLTYPAADTQVADKTVSNTFLWDYYYDSPSGHNHLDENTDTYQTYYSQERQFKNYPLLAKAKPYIIGFPGKTYYEFDLSGEWTAQTTDDPKPTALRQQVITFVSKDTCIHVWVCDSVLEATKAANTNDGYVFWPNYLKKEVTDGYLLNAAGDAFVMSSEAASTTVMPFRPYFTKASASGRTRGADKIVFINKGIAGDEEPASPWADEANGQLRIYAKKGRIVVESLLKETTGVRIVNMAGITVNTFNIEPGETVETRVPMSGIYIVNRKKLSVR